MSGQSWEEIEQDFPRHGLGSIMTATPPMHSTTPISLRTKLTSVAAATKKHKKPQKPRVRQSPRTIPTEQRSKERMDKLKKPMEAQYLDEE